MDTQTVFYCISVSVLVGGFFVLFLRAQRKPVQQEDGWREPVEAWAKLRGHEDAMLQRGAFEPE